MKSAGPPRLLPTRGFTPPARAQLRWPFGAGALSLMMLSACHPAPSLEACADYRIATYYYSADNVFWSGPHAGHLCIVREMKVEK